MVFRLRLEESDRVCGSFRAIWMDGWMDRRGFCASGIGAFFVLPTVQSAARVVTQSAANHVPRRAVSDRPRMRIEVDPKVAVLWSCCSCIHVYAQYDAIFSKRATR